MEQVQDVLRLVGDVMGPEVIGAYLHGSSVLGGLKPASDLDVLVVSRRSLTGRQRRALLDGLFTVSGGDARRPVELTVVVQADVRPWRFPPQVDFLYGEWLRGELASGGVPRPHPAPDLALVIMNALAGDHPLLGPPPAEVLDPVPHADLVRAATAGIPGLLEDLDGDTRNVVLTLARIWRTLATGQISSKDDAAGWALAQLPPQHRPVLERARELYLTSRYSEEIWSDELTAQVRPHVDHVLTEIEQLRAGERQPRPQAGATASARGALEAGSRTRNQPAPPHVVFEALTDPDRDPARPWLVLLDDERRPRTLEARMPHLVVWSSIWTRRPDAMVRFDLASDGAAGTALRWTLLLAEPPPEPSLLGHLRKRLNQLINANLRFTFGQ